MPNDLWGIPQLNPTAPGGREWYMPADLSQAAPEWQPEAASVGPVQDVIPYWHTCGDTDWGEIRMNVGSPVGKAWWRNVEIGGYFRRHSVQPSADGQRSHIELVVRSERHSTRNFPPSQFAGGVPAPPGTATAPGYPYTGLATVNAHSAGSSYHGNIYDGSVLFEKEVTHIAGYSGQRGKVTVPGLSLDNRLPREPHQKSY